MAVASTDNDDEKRGFSNFGLEIEIAGLTPGAGVDGYDQLIVTDLASLGGALDVRLIDGFGPQHGDIFEIVSAGEIVGDFIDYSGDVFRLGTSNIALVPVVETSPDRVTIVTTAPGDADGNGFVDFFDFLDLQNHFEQPGDWYDGDFDGNGFVDFLDFLLLQNNFDQDFTGGAGVLAGLASETQLAVLSEFAITGNIPEPGTAGLLTIGLGLMMRRRRSYD